MGKKGEIKFVGPYADRPEPYVGIELEVPKGKNSGIIKGVKMFECRENHGIFAKYNDILKFCKIINPNSPNIQKSPSSVSFQEIPPNEASPKPLTKSPSDASLQNSPLSRSKTFSSDSLIESREALEAKLKKYQEYISITKEKLEKLQEKTNIVQKLIQRKEIENEADLNGRKQEFAKIIYKKQIKLEQDLIKIEEECIQSARRVRVLAETADGRVSKAKIVLLEKINNEHIEYQQSLQQLLDAQRINLSTASRSIQTLKRRVPRTANTLKKHQQNLEILKKNLKEIEGKLSEKVPDFKDVNDLKEKVDKLRLEDKEIKLKEKMKEIDSEIMTCFITEIMQKDNPLIVLAFKVSLLHAKAKSYAEFANGKKKALAFYLLYILEFIQVILTGFHSRVSGFQEIVEELDKISNSIDNGKLTIDCSKLVNITKDITYIQLDQCLTPHFLKYISYLSTNQENKSILTDIANEMDISLHPDFMEPEDGKLLMKIISELKNSHNGNVFNSIEDLINLYEKYGKRKMSFINILKTKDDENKKAKEKLVLLAQQEKDKYEEQVLKIEEERDRLCKERLQLLEKIKSKK
ncbi:CAP-Gly domain containing protein [Trichomonas vaginalis G3]|uniref:CAP-Gly domain containing protein n=1 Tax=Trichomonas vaginalis (strain ATCC PRA-98 / G3) TaxID=412133 RepID=A2FDP4_TRIV3|nr:microtubule motor protein [Trichomonas vaginalis G3]EAX96988.1 CAP-Gly domain containing protein [Trichomonas vaginalis G3]KAI5524923.1 microtubule motor protein [Trichomonas vaginalis G3]|eukprot:XP_001309918.1 CAP-Gly domain containing protein [Trichomonas vaginalis G3]